MRLRVALPVTLLVLLTASMQSSLLVQSSECTCREARVQLPSTDPVFVDAMELARYLIDHGFIVKCVPAPKEQHGFEGQKGGALFRTHRGSFGVAFLPKEENFNALEVVEQRRGTRYLYFFRGTPRSPAHIDSSKPTYYIKFKNVSFDEFGDAQLTAIIQAAIRQ